MKFSIKDFFSKCDQILRKLRISSHLLKNTSWRLLLLVDNVNKEYEQFSGSESSASGCCLTFAWIFVNFSLALLIKVLLIKESMYSLKFLFKFYTVRWNPDYRKPLTSQNLILLFEYIHKDREVMLWWP